ncbi:MAG TPA: amidohydrolase family protein, partial [Pseudoxanthomonas sp.]|nr:amidohydrolase family protein [Pseudoxanthomonas sp.]
MRKFGWMLSAVMVAVPAQAWAAKVTVLSAARIHTMETAQPRAQAMAFDEQGRILALGNTAALLKRYPGARRLDVGAATVIPGLIDAHAHVSGLGFSMMGADLTGTRDKDEIFARLKAKAAGLKPGEWLLGSGWDQNDWPEKEYPSAAELDALFPDRPVWLSRIDGHAGWANTQAMRAVSRD